MPSDRPDSGLPDSRSNDARTEESDADADAAPYDAVRLATGEITIHGVTSDDHVIVSRKTNAGTTALEAIKLADGTTTTILASLADGTWVSVKGNAVAVWSNVSVTGVGHLSIWTPEAKLSADVAGGAPARYFWASEDGKRVAYYANAATHNDDVESTELVVRDTDTGDSAAVLAGDERVSFADDACGSSIGFVGTTMLATYCSVTNPQARLVTVPASGAKTAQFLVGGVYSFWSADTTGSKIFVIAEDLAEGMVVSNDGSDPPAITSLEFDVKDGFVMKDGSAVVYRAGTTLRRLPLGGGAGAVATIAKDEVRHVWGISSDQKRVLFNSLPGIPVDPQDPGGQRYFDLRIVDTSATDVDARVLVPTESAIPVGFSGNDTHALFFSKGPKLDAIGATGTSRRSMPIQFRTMAVTPTGSGAVLSEDARTTGGIVGVDLVHVDFAAGDPTSDALVRKVVAKGVMSGEYAFGKAAPQSFVFVSVGTEPGLYRTSLP